MENINLPTMRKYRHYKGGEYLLIAIANNNTGRDDFEPTAVYYSLKDNKLYSRDLSEFVDKFTLTDSEEQVVAFVAQIGSSVKIDGKERSLMAVEIPSALLTAFNKDIAFGP